MLECKLAQSSASVYVQDVKAAPFVLSNEWQLKDLVGFGTNNRQFCVDIGTVLCYPITYHHNYDAKERNHPGPILVHQKVDFAAFNYFASTLIGCKRELLKDFWY